MREIQLLTETSTQIRVSVRPKAHPSPNRRQADDNCRNSRFWQVFLSQGLPVPHMKLSRTTPSVQTRQTIDLQVVCYDESMSSNSEFTGEDQESGLNTALRSSTAVAATSPKSILNKELRATPLRPGAVARQLLAEDEKDEKQELFRHLPESYSLAHRLRRHGWSTLRYLMQTEVHTYAFSVAANSILSLFPFIVLMLTVVRRVFHSPAMYNVVLELVRDYLPSNKDFVIRNLQFLAGVKGRGQVLSLAMLLITSTGVFLPLEVALNSVWGFKKNRSYLMNLLVSLGLALGCGCLAMLSIALTAQNLKMLGLVIGDQNIVFRGVRVYRDESLGDPGDNRDLLPDLLAVATRKSSGARGVAGSDHHWSGVRGGEVHLYPRAALAQLPGSVRAVRGVSLADLLGIQERDATAGRRVSAAAVEHADRVLARRETAAANR